MPPGLWYIDHQTFLQYYTQCFTGDPDDSSDVFTAMVNIFSSAHGQMMVQQGLDSKFRKYTISDSFDPTEDALAESTKLFKQTYYRLKKKSSPGIKQDNGKFVQPE